MLIRSPQIITGPRVPVVAAGGAWAPTDLGVALKAWYKADAGVYNDAGTALALDSQTVRQWNDQSGNFQQLGQPTIAARPVFLTNVLNSLPVVSFVAATPTWIIGASTLDLGGTTASAFMVVKYTAADANGRILAYSNGAGGDTGAANCIFAYEPTSLTTINGYSSGIKSTGSISSSTWNQIGSIFDGVNHTLYINGTGQTSVGATPTLQANGTIAIATSGAGADTLTMQVAEIIITNTAIGGTDRTGITTYFTSRWGV